MFSQEFGDPDPCPRKWQLFPVPLLSNRIAGNRRCGGGGAASGDAINTAGTSKLAGQGCVCEAINPVSAGVRERRGNAQLFPLIKEFPRLKVYFVFEESEPRGCLRPPAQTLKGCDPACNNIPHTRV